MKVLITLKEYCHREKITDAAARRRALQFLKIDDLTYIVEDSNEVQELKNKNRNLTLKLKEQKARNEMYIRQDDLIEEQKERIKKLEARTEALEWQIETQQNKLIEQVETKEKLYEKFISGVLNLENKQK